MQRYQVQIWMPKLHASQLPAPSPFEDNKMHPSFSLTNPKKKTKNTTDNANVKWYHKPTNPFHN